MRKHVNELGDEILIWCWQAIFAIYPFIQLSIKTMPKFTIQKSGHPPKQRVILSECQNSSSAANLLLKHIKKQEFVHPDKMHEIQSTDNEPESKATPQVIKDVTGIECTLTHYCILSSDPVLEDTNFVKLGEFNYCQFETLVIRKPAQAARVEF